MENTILHEVRKIAQEKQTQQKKQQETVADKNIDQIHKSQRLTEIITSKLEKVQQNKSVYRKAENYEANYQQWISQLKLKEFPISQIIYNQQQVYNTIDALLFTWKCLKEKEKILEENQNNFDSDEEEIQKQTLLNTDIQKQYEYKDDLIKQNIFIDNQVFVLNQRKSCKKFLQRQKQKNSNQQQAIEKVIKSKLKAGNCFEFILSQYTDFFYSDLNNNQQDFFYRFLFDHLISHLKNQDKLKKNNKILQENQIKIQGFNNLKILVITNFNLELSNLLWVFKEKLNNQQEDFLQELEDKIQQLDTEETGMQSDGQIGLGFQRNKFFVQNNPSKQYILFTTLENLINNKNAQSLLSSLEIIYLDNFENFILGDLIQLKNLLQNTNQIPKHENVIHDFTQIKNIFLENKSKFFRQIISYGKVQTLESQGILNQVSNNFWGFVINKVYFTSFIQDYLNLNEVSFKISLLRVHSLIKANEEKQNFLINSLWKQI